MGNTPLIVTVAGCCAVAVAGFLVWRARFETYHFATVDPGKVFRDGNRSVREFATMMRKCRARTVVALVDDAEIADPEKPEFGEELTFLQQQGVALERIPIPLGGWPTTQDVRRFLDVATDPARQPVVFHCAQGVRRTGMLAAAYQMSVLGWDKEETKAAILRFGHSDRSIGDVVRFIDVYDPANRRVTQQLAPSKE